MRLQQAETTASDLVCCCCTYRLMKVRRCASVACYCGAATANESFRVLSRTAGEKEPRLQTPKLLAATATALVLRLPYATALLTALLPLPFYCNCDFLVAATALLPTLVATAVLQPAVLVHRLLWVVLYSLLLQRLRYSAEATGLDPGNGEATDPTPGFSPDLLCLLALRCSSVKRSSANVRG